MIYDLPFSVDSTTGAIDVTNGGVHTRTKRVAVHSMFYNDIRHDYSNAHGGSGNILVRGNIRQVGTKIVYCGPGEIRTDTHDQSPANGGSNSWLGESNFKRCTWNWNFHEGMTAVGNLASVPEEWFSRSNPLNNVVWSGGADTDRHVDTNNGMQDHVSPIVESVQFRITFQDDTDAGPAVGTLTRTLRLDAAKYFTEPTKIDSNAAITTDGHQFTFTMMCLASPLDGTGAQIPQPTPANGIDNSQADIAGIGDTSGTNLRDIFPDCYMGDEIHFELEIAGGASGDSDHRISAWYSFVDATFQSST